MDLVHIEYLIAAKVMQLTHVSRISVVRQSDCLTYYVLERAGIVHVANIIASTASRPSCLMLDRNYAESNCYEECIIGQ